MQSTPRQDSLVNDLDAIPSAFIGIDRVVLALEERVRRRVRLYSWKQWKRPGTRVVI
ncbi:MAG: hypothetical protein MUC91_09990 [Verrucomicrobia bacterium]|jgi:hypothetical protein|nr:hypothetical protein [Verrucomicrobiota bacterium]